MIHEKKVKITKNFFNNILSIKGEFSTKFKFCNGTLNINEKEGLLNFKFLLPKHIGGGYAEQCIFIPREEWMNITEFSILKHYNDAKILWRKRNPLTSQKMMMYHQEKGNKWIINN